MAVGAGDHRGGAADAAGGDERAVEVGRQRTGASQLPPATVIAVEEEHEQSFSFPKQ
jgi:hypothetical protein